MMDYYRSRYNPKYPDRFLQGADYLRKGKRYIMCRDRLLSTSLRDFEVIHPYFELYQTGVLLIKSGYLWDGPSSIAIDTPSFMRGSAGHDVKFQILRERMIEDFKRRGFFYKSNVDLKNDCLADGMWRMRANWVFKSVQKFGYKYAC